MTTTALVTGAGGFLGSHLVRILLEGGWRVRAFVRYHSTSSWGQLEELRSSPPEGLEVVLGDVTEPRQVREAVEGQEVVFHLAALISIPYSYLAARAFLDTNALGTLNLAQAALDAGTRRLVLASTSEVYGTARYAPIDEEHPLQAQSPYAASKIAAEKIVESFFRSFALPAVIVRPFNTYGPGQSARAVIPTIVLQALGGERIRLGALDPVRDLSFVSDTVAGLLAAARAENVVGSAFNLGTGHAVSIGELVSLIQESLGVDLPVETDPLRIRPAASEVRRLVSDNRKAARELDWQPRVDLRAGLAQTIDWIRANRHRFRASGYTV